MAGLLDMLQNASNDPATSQGILRFGLSLLQSKGNFGSAVGAAGVQGLQGAQDYRQQAYQKQQQQYQLAQQKRAMDLQNLPSQFVTGGVKPDTMDNRDVGQPGEAAVPPPSFDMTGYTNALMGKDPMQGLQMQALLKKEQPQPIKLGEGDTLVDPTTFKPVATNAKVAKPPEAPSAIKEYEYAKGQGYTGTFQQFQLEGKRAGASQVNTKIENQLGGGLAKEVGPMVKESYDAARGAQQAIATADSITKAVDSNKLFTGPTATLRLKGAQLAQTLGIGGKDDAEKIANTRTAIQGLAQSTLASRGQLKGQGQVSDFEGRLIERAASGDIDNMTAGEIRQIAQVNKRLAQQVLSNHGQFISKLKDDKTTAPMANMFELPTQAAQGGSKTVNFSDLK